MSEYMQVWLVPASLRPEDDWSHRDWVRYWSQWSDGDWAEEARWINTKSGLWSRAEWVDWFAQYSQNQWAEWCVKHRKRA